MHGFSLGLAIDLSSACDIRLCSSDAKFGIMVSPTAIADQSAGWAVGRQSYRILVPG